MNSETKLEICEIFYSLQGESTFSGLPCIFIRLSGCNLHCVYCDSLYSHAPGTFLSIAEILERIKAYPCKLVEITGGEPVFQDELPELISALESADYTILLETNGSLYLGDFPESVTKIIDVKTPGSGEGESFMKWNLKLILPHDEIKFVLTNFHDYQFALNFIRDNKLEEQTILFSPVTSVLPAKQLAEWMLKDGVNARLQIQLHKIINMP